MYSECFRVRCTNPGTDELRYVVRSPHGPHLEASLTLGSLRKPRCDGACDVSSTTLGTHPRSIVYNETLILHCDVSSPVNV